MEAVRRSASTFRSSQLDLPGRVAFTLVELLVVIAIIGVLVALLLPAVQSAREAARRAQCQNHCKQVALALINYHDSSGSLPFGSGWTNDTGQWEQVATWAAMVLPYLEEQSVYDTFRFDLHMAHPFNRHAVATPIATYQCPSDASGDDAVMGHRCTCCNGGPLRSHVLWYAASMGPNNDDACIFCAEGPGSFCCLGASYGSGGDFSGMFGRHTRTIEFKEVTDGLSKTIMIGETLPKHCFHNTAYGRNFPVAGMSIPLNTMIGKEGQQDNWDQTTLHNRNSHYQACGFKSEHPGGAFFALGDGSVQFISQSIDYRLYCALGSRSGNEVSDGYQ